MSDEILKMVLKETNERMSDDDNPIHYGLDERYHEYQIDVLNNYIAALNECDYEPCIQLKKLLKLYKKSNEEVLQLRKKNYNIFKLSESVQVPIIALQKEYERQVRPWKIQTRCLLVTNIILSCLCIYLLYFRG